MEKSFIVKYFYFVINLKINLIYIKYKIFLLYKVGGIIMKRENKILEDKLPKNCCTFCSHLSLEGPDENFRYYIKCIIKNSIPKPSDCCEFFVKNILT